MADKWDLDWDRRTCLGYNTGTGSICSRPSEIHAQWQSKTNGLIEKTFYCKRCHDNAYRSCKGNWVIIHQASYKEALKSRIV